MQINAFELGALLRRWSANGVSTRSHIFITGVPRSGTTLLKTVLTASPYISGTDYESTGLFRWRSLANYSSGEITNERIRGFLSQTRSLVELYDRVADENLYRYGGKYFVDKIWPRSWRIKYVVRRFPEARWIQIIRDGRDAYCSAKKHPNVPQSRSLEAFARYWRSCLKMTESLIPADQLFTVKYELLAAHSDQTIERLFESLGLEVSLLDLMRARQHQLPSIQNRDVHANLARPLSPASVGRFRQEMSVPELKRFETIAGQFLRMHDYVLTGSSS